MCVLHNLIFYFVRYLIIDTKNQTSDFAKYVIILGERKSETIGLETEEIFRIVTQVEKKLCEK